MTATIDPAGSMAAVVRRNVAVLGVSLAASWAVVQLVAAVSAVTLARLTYVTSTGGIAPGVFLFSWALASLGMGQFMDAHGRAPGLRAGFALGVAGALVVFAGITIESVSTFLAGLLLVGACCGTVNLARAGAADMYPPARRARGISYVLAGAGLGAIASPIVFAPMLRGVRSGAAEMDAPWLIAAALLAAGFVVTFAIRIDPIEIARRAAGAGTAPALPGAARRPLPEILRTPGVLPALFAAVVSQAVMSSLMTVIGLTMVAHGHDLASVTATMSAHFVGMFGLVLVAGRVVDGIGRTRSIVIGLLILAGGLLILVTSPAFLVVMLGMFAIGIGWNLAFVASTAVLADAARPLERARLLGFSDFGAMAAAAAATVLAGALLGMAGLNALVAVAACLTLTPLLPLLIPRPRTAGAPA